MNQEKTIFDKFKTYLIFAGPSTFIFFTVIILPFLFGIYLTFTDWNGIAATQRFVGTENYSAVFKDKEFWGALGKTSLYVLCTVTITNLVAFLLAFILTSGIKAQNFFRSGFFTPNLIGGVTLGFIWQFIFSRVLVSIGKALGISIFSTSWLADPTKAFWALVVVSVWQYSGYMMIIYIAGFMNVPKDILEAASIDGATGAKRMSKIILPMMIPSFTVCVFLSLQRAFMVYDVNLSLTKGGPFRSTELISMSVYNKAFLSQEYGVGQAQAFFLFLMVTAVTLIQVYFSKRMEVEA